MTDRPILFSGPMIRALLEGRKTQTRRVLTPASMPDGWPGTMWPSYVNGQRVGDLSGKPGMIELPAADGGTIWSGPTPYVPGDRLWVRETLQANSNDQGARWYGYAADSADVWPMSEWLKSRNSIPSIHMPRWASRLTLIVTDVRVQRLQEITWQDAKAEGISGGYHQSEFASLWDGLNAKRGYGWDANPWVVALTFNVIKQNIDQIEKEAA